jgi:Protein of unknown function (DUF2924)
LGGCCPAHRDRNPSLALRDSVEGQVLVRCHAGCTQASVIAALKERGLWIEKTKPSRSRIVAEYSYTDEHDLLLYQVVRTEPKGSFPRYPDGLGGWVNRKHRLARGGRSRRRPAGICKHALAIAQEASLRIQLRRRVTDSVHKDATVIEIVSDHDSRLPMAGSVIVKEYRGKTIIIHVLDEGFEYNGRRFASLSAIAKDITGTKWNGFVFFGLAKEQRRGR